MWWCWWLEDELMVVGGGYAAFGGSAEGGERIARERHGPAQAAAGGDGAGQRHDAPGHEGISGWAVAMCLTIRRGGRFLFGSMSTATATAGARLGPIASARFPGIGANIM